MVLSFATHKFSFQVQKMAFNPLLDGHKINMRSEFADTVTRKWTRAEVDNIMQQLVFDSNSSSLSAEAMTLDAIDAEWMGGMMVLDSAVITTNMRTLNGKFTESISRTLTRKLSPDLSISGSEVGKVKKSGLYASIAAIFHVSDGQTVTIIFHAPDGDPKVIAQDDTLIAFRVLMNKTDITSHVLPQLISTKGVTSLDQVSTNIASLLKANTDTFKGKQAKIADQKKELEAKTAELRKLEAAQVEAVQMEADAEKHMADADEKGAGLESRIKRVEEENAVLQEKIDKLKAKKAEAQPEATPSVTTDPAPIGKSVPVKELRDAIRILENLYHTHRHATVGFAELKRNAESIQRFADELRPLVSSRAKPEDKADKEKILKLADEYLKGFDWSGEQYQQGQLEQAQKKEYKLQIGRELSSVGFSQSSASGERFGERGNAWIDIEDQTFYATIDRDNTSAEVVRITAKNNDAFPKGQYFHDVAINGRDPKDIARDVRAFVDAPIAPEAQPEPATTPEAANEPEEPKPEADPYASRIEALRTMPLKEYETAMDALIAELEDAGKLADYEAVLTEIDKVRDEDLKKLVEGA